MKKIYETPAIEVFKFSLSTGVCAATVSDIPENSHNEGTVVTLDPFNPFG